MSKRKSMAKKAFYLVYVKGCDVPLVCKWTGDAFKRYVTMSAFGEGSWRELSTVNDVVKYVRVDNLMFEEI